MFDYVLLGSQSIPSILYLPLCPSQSRLFVTLILSSGPDKPGVPGTRQVTYYNVHEISHLSKTGPISLFIQRYKEFDLKNLSLNKRGSRRTCFEKIEQYLYHLRFTRYCLLTRPQYLVKKFLWVHLFSTYPRGVSGVDEGRTVHTTIIPLKLRERKSPESKEGGVILQLLTEDFLSTLFPFIFPTYFLTVLNQICKFYILRHDYGLSLFWYLT